MYERCPSNDLQLPDFFPQSLRRLMQRIRRACLPLLEHPQCTKPKQLPVLAEVSPPAFRATFPGVAYQLSNMISSASSQIEAKGGENLRTAVLINGVAEEVPDYATVQGILVGVVAAFILVVTILGPEAHSAHFEKHKTAFEEGGGRDDALIEEVGSVDSSHPIESLDEKEAKSLEEMA
ncbi:unnamed protein product [Peniophora sp. CBMAI 1063]|nr:unnamed protein product [Peniophora sp. CBMAI 1063]